MLKGATRTFNLYNFFSVLLPGIAFVLALAPFFPAGHEIDPILTVVPLLAGGFIIGQAVHSIAVVWQSHTTKRTHREQFQELLKDDVLEKYSDVDYEGEDDVLDPEQLITEDVLKSFYNRCDGRFDSIDLPEFDDRREAPERVLRDLYTLVRSVVHMDGRGRSRTFQAIYAFCRSMWVSMLVLWVVYFVYIVIRLLNVHTDTLSTLASPEARPTYTPVLSTTIGNPMVVFLLATAVFLSGHKVFRTATDEYKQYFTQYLITDFLLITDDDTPSPVPDLLRVS